MFTFAFINNDEPDGVIVFVLIMEAVNGIPPITSTKFGEALIMGEPLT
jgi:hypothetical protein